MKQTFRVRVTFINGSTWTELVYAISEKRAMAIGRKLAITARPYLGSPLRVESMQS